MPGLNGMLVLRELRGSIEFCDLPVLVLTARTSEADVGLIFQEGASDYLKKPFDPQELLFRVDELLAAKAKYDGSRSSAR